MRPSPTTGATGAPADRAAARQRLAGLGGAFLALAGVTYLLAVGTARGQLVDEELKGFWLPLREDVGGVAHSLFELLGWPLLGVSLVLALATCVARRDLVLGVLAGAILVGGPAIVSLAQRVLHRPMLGEGTFPSHNTLPSGHASVAAAAALVLLLLVKPARRRLGLVVAVVVAVVGVVGPVGAAAHRPSDVAAAFLVVGSWAAFVLLAAGRGAPAWRDGGQARKVATAGIAGGLGALAVLGAAVARAPENVPAASNAIWLATIVLVAGVGVTAIATLAPTLLAGAGRGRPVPLGRAPAA